LAEALEPVPSAAQVEFEDKSALRQALRECYQSGADFADRPIGVKDVGAGCATTLTFDPCAGGCRSSLFGVAGSAWPRFAPRLRGSTRRQVGPATLAGLPPGS
jgi:hypothetical protein